MAAGCCFIWCMRYNPSQALSLLLDPLISEDSAKFQTDIGGFVHSGSGKLVTCSRAFYRTRPALIPLFRKSALLPEWFVTLRLTTKRSNIAFVQVTNLN